MKKVSELPKKSFQTRNSIFNNLTTTFNSPSPKNKRIPTTLNSLTRPKRFEESFNESLRRATVTADTINLKRNYKRRLSMNLQWPGSNLIIQYSKFDKKKQIMEKYQDKLMVKWIFKS